MVAAPLPKRVIDFYRAQVEPGDRFYVQAPVTAGALNDAMIVAGYALLPAVMVARPDQANVIVSYEADPGTLPYRYASIARLRHGVSVARIADVR